AFVFNSCQPTPSPLIAGVITAFPPFRADQVIPWALHARCTPSSPLPRKYENRYAGEPEAGCAEAGSGPACVHAARPSANAPASAETTTETNAGNGATARRCRTTAHARIRSTDASGE